MSQVYATPGVYIEEKSAFPSSAVAVATAVPAFIGYTEKHLDGNKTLLNKPTRITSLAEFHQYFGVGPKVLYDVTGTGTAFTLTVDPLTKFNLYSSMRLFFSNGGSTCYIVSVGEYDYAKGVTTAVLNPPADGGIKTLLKELEPTMLVIPDAVLLPQADCYSLQQDMLMHCGVDMRNRVALLDVYNGYEEPKQKGVIEQFRDGIGNNNLQWAAAYYPWVETTIVPDSEVDISNIKTAASLTPLLDAELKQLYPKILDKTQTPAVPVDDPRYTTLSGELAKLANLATMSPTDVTALHQTLLTKIPLYKAILGELRANLNRLPPSGGMAGVISMVDHTIGVAKSPANVSMGKVIRPSVNITNLTQEDLNLPLNGKAVNAIRTFPGKGVLVWGARTLDGNSQDWRYLSVRRTIIMIEQSLKIAAEAYVFEPNVSNTWVTIRGMMTNFLTDQWKRGALAGATPEDAFSVDIGLGVTMTPTDILDGIMNISIKLAVVRPAEFIVITIQQQMQKS